MHRKLIYSFLLVGLLVPDVQFNKDDLVIQRLLQITALNGLTAKKAWPQAIKNISEVPIIYYSPPFCFTAHPNAQFLARFTPTIIYRAHGVKYVKTKSAIDDQSFHMEVSVSQGADSNSFDYNYPFVKCSSFEVAKKTIPGLTYGSWQAMIVHESFHIYQYRQKAYLDNAIATGAINPALGDSLQLLYKSTPLFKKQADQENALLMQALMTEKKQVIDSLSRVFFLIRDKRRKIIAENTGLHIEKLEKAFETLEGTARYMEATALKISSRQDMRSGKIYAAPEWLYSSVVSDRYFYATGYNLCRLLDKLASDYKERLFINSGLTLEDLLKEKMR